MIVDLVAESGVADLIEPLKMIKAHGVAVWHEQPVKRNGEPPLPETLHLPRFTEKFRSCRNQQTLAVMRIDIVCKKTFNGTGELPVETVEENGFEDGSFKQDVGFARRRGRCLRHG